MTVTPGPSLPCRSQSLLRHFHLGPGGADLRAGGPDRVRAQEVRLPGCPAGRKDICSGWVGGRQAQGLGPLTDLLGGSGLSPQLVHPHHRDRWIPEGPRPCLPPQIPPQPKQVRGAERGACMLSFVCSPIGISTPVCTPQLFFYLGHTWQLCSGITPGRLGNHKEYWRSNPSWPFTRQMASTSPLCHGSGPPQPF